MGMECRCYHGGEARTKLKVLRAGKRDAFAAVLVVLVCAGVIVSNIFLPGALS